MSKRIFHLDDYANLRALTKAALDQMEIEFNTRSEGFHALDKRKWRGGCGEADMYLEDAISQAKWIRKHWPEAWKEGLEVMDDTMFKTQSDGHNLVEKARKERESMGRVMNDLLGDKTDE